MKRRLLLAAVFSAVVLAWTLAVLGVSGKTQAGRPSPEAVPAAVKPATQPAPAAVADPRTFLAVYRQPARNAAVWGGRGVNVVVGYEPEADQAGNATVSQQAWRAAYAAAGIKYLCEPVADLAAEDRDANLVGILYPQDEPDNAVVEAADRFVNDWSTSPPTVKDPAGQAAAVEAVYAGLEAFYRNAKAKAPHKPVVINLGLEQLPWHKVDYARLLAACDWAMCDWYPCMRGRPVSAYGDMIDLLRAVKGGDKLVLAFVECSAQHLDPGSYPNQHCPSVDEFTGEVQLVQARKLSVGLFPQQIGQDGKVFFEYDAEPPELINAFRVLVAPATAPLPAPPALPDTLIINGATYRKAA